MGRFAILFAILVVPLFVAGCALPPAFTVASFAADGISYLATGKSTTDHALSAIASEDCALARAVKEKPICVPNRKAPVFVAATERPAKRPSHPDGNDAQYQSSPTSVLAVMQAHRDFSAGPDPSRSPQLAEKKLPAAPAAAGPVQLAEKDTAAVPQLAGMPANIGRFVLSYCAGGGGMQPAAQCILGPDA